MTDARPPYGLTRRTVLAGAAAAGAAGLVGPVAGLAEAIERRPSIFGQWVGSVAGQSGELRAPRRFSLLGVEWAAPAGAKIELRTRAGDGTWSRWALASVTGHGPDHPKRSGSRFGDPIWTGPADSVQLRSSLPVQGVRLHFVAADLTAGAQSAPGRARSAAAFPLAQPVLDAGPGQPPIIARRAWSHGAPPAVPPGYGTIKLAFVHHTENPNGYTPDEVPAMLLAIYQFHRFVRGWNDIGYNFVIDLFGRIWEAREGGIDRAVVGAQAGGYNLESTGISVLGTFMDVAPSAAAIDALERLLAWKLSLHGVPTTGRVTVVVDPAAAFYTPFKPGAHVSLPRVAGHRDGDSTACPGNAFYARLPAIRPVVARLAGTPATLQLAAAPASAVAPATIGLSGRLGLLHGPPLAGATIELQEVAPNGASTVASATTAADGSWTSMLELSANTAVQAVHPDAPAAVSDVAQIAVAPAIELIVRSRSPLRLSGRVFPATRHAIVDVYSLGHGHRRRVAARHATVRRGRFTATVPLRRRGRYELIARTRASAANAPGVSKPVVVTL
jgi:N-acetylmuramoyl-L-alanine amidase